MMKIFIMLWALCLITAAQEKEVPMTASIGSLITVQGEMKPAKSFNRVVSSSKIEIFVSAEDDVNAYVFMLKNNKYIPVFKSFLQKNNLNRLPGKNMGFTLSADAKNQKLIIILTGKSNTELDDLLLEQDELSGAIHKIAATRIITDKAPKMLNIGGNLRSLEDDLFKNYTGSNYIYKEYNFEVRK